jgi:hypothetical protein
MAEQGLDVGNTGAGGIGQKSRNMRPGGRGGSIVAPFDPVSAREAARRRWENVSKAARLGLADAAASIDQLPIDRRSSVGVVRFLVEQHTLNAADPSARGATQSFKQVMDLAYPKPEREVAAASAVPAGGATIALSPELARALLAELRRGSDSGGNVVEHRARQADSE